MGADIWMDVDAALAEVPVNIMPLLDSTDFKSIEAAVAYDAAGMALYWHFVTTAGAYTVTAVTPTTGGNYDWTDQGDSGIYTIEIPASGGASINNDTEGFGWFTGSATGVLPWRGPVIGFRAAALNNALIDGGAVLDANMTQISGDSTAADNAELMFDGTGYAGGTTKLDVNVVTIEATDATNAINAEVDTALSDINLDHLLKVAVTGADVVDNTVIAKLVSKSGTADWDTFSNTTDALEALADGMASLAPVSATADSATVTTGSTISGTYANTSTDDASNYTLAPVTPAVGGFGLNVSISFELGTGRVPTSVAVNGYWSGSGRYCHVYAYDFSAAAWRQLSNTSNYMAHRTSETNYAYTLSREHVEADGTVTLRFASPSTTTADRLYLDRILVYHLTEAVQGSTGATPQQVWEYTSRTLTSSTGEPVDTDAIVTGVFSEALPGAYGVGSAGYLIGTNLDAPVSTVGGGASAADIADAVLEELIEDHDGVSGSLAEIIAVNSVILATNLDAAVSTRAATGDPMTLADDAITAAKYDELTAFPITAADTGPTYIARTGADADTLATLSGQLDAIAAGGMAGAGAYTFTYTVTNATTGLPIDGCEVWVTTDLAGSNIVAAGWTDTFGQVVFYLDAGSHYFWRRLSGYSFSPQPDTEVVGD